MDPALTREVISMLNQAHDMTIATVREDGYPQATAVSYVNDGLTIYFGCAAESQKAKNIARCDKVSLTVNLSYARWDEIRGLSIGGKAAAVADPQERDRVEQLMFQKFPQLVQHLDRTLRKLKDAIWGSEYAPTDIGELVLFRISPEVISLLDYRKGFGHTDLIRVSA
jgi:nitroimidazol reductase NimA-like FMN-containing flavoprotein (pyridoxamine 5'-phosphate oxidase superfamily)